MSESQSCPNCGGTVFKDTCGVENTEVCSDCGCIIALCELAQPHVDDYGSSYHTEGRLTKQFRVTLNHREELICISQRGLMKTIRVVLGKYSNNKELDKTARKVFMDVMSLDECHYKRLPFKTAVAACVTLTVLRSVGVQVTMPKICDEFEISTKGMLSVMKLVKQCSTISTTDPTGEEFSIKDCLEPYLEHHIRKEREALKNRAVAISKLFLHLKVAQSRETLASVAFYFSLVSSNPHKLTPLSMATFLKKYRIPYNRQTTVRSTVAVARSKIFILAKRLPWVTSGVKPLNCHIYINDILKWKNILIKDREEDGGDEVPSTSSEDVVITEQMKLEMPKCFIRNLQKPPPCENDETLEPGSVSRSEEIEEDEFSNQEISELLRTKEEINIAAKLRHDLSMDVLPY